MAKADPYHALIAMDECSNPKCRLCPACIQLLNDLIGQHLGANEIAYEVAYNPAAVALGRKGGKATSDAKTAAVRENGKKGGYPKGRPRKPKD